MNINNDVKTVDGLTTTLVGNLFPLKIEKKKKKKKR